MRTHDRGPVRRPADEERPAEQHPRAWGVVLAGGEARAPFRIEAGRRRSVLQQVMDRMSQVLARRRTFLVVDSGHRERLHRSLVPPHEGPVMVQPRGAGSWTSVLLALTYLHERTPDCLLVVCPARDHRFTEGRFVWYLRALCRLAARHPDHMMLLGAAASSTAARPGWLLRISHPRRAETGTETPRARPLLHARELSSIDRQGESRGAGEVPGTGVWAFRTEALWRVAWGLDPGAMRRFDDLRLLVPAAVFSRAPSDREAAILSKGLEGLDPVGFTSAILRRAPSSVMVVPMTEAAWSDEDAWDRADGRRRPRRRVNALEGASP